MLGAVVVRAPMGGHRFAVAVLLAASGGARGALRRRPWRSWSHCVGTSPGWRVRRAAPHSPSSGDAPHLAPHPHRPRYFHPWLHTHIARATSTPWLHTYIARAAPTSWLLTRAPSAESCESAPTPHPESWTKALIARPIPTTRRTARTGSGRGLGVNDRSAGLCVSRHSSGALTRRRAQSRGRQSPAAAERCPGVRPRLKAPRRSCVLGYVVTTRIATALGAVAAAQRRLTRTAGGGNQAAAANLSWEVTPRLPKLLAPLTSASAAPDVHTR